MGDVDDQDEENESMGADQKEDESKLRWVLSMIRIKKMRWVLSMESALCYLLSMR